MSRALTWMALQHLFQSRRQALALLLMFALSNMLALLTGVYNVSVRQAFGAAGQDYLVVQEFNQLGELGGSRLSPEIGRILAAQGFSEIIPEIHTAVGVSLEQVIQLRGVNPADYRRTVDFEILSGQALDEHTPARQVVLGWRLAERLRAKTGSTIQLRGRNFQVQGVFRMRTYADNEAWITLADAQALLGWGEDVSIYLVPNDGRLQPGDRLGAAPQPQAEVVRRGEAVQALTGQVGTLLAYLQSVTRVALLSCGLTLGVVLLRLAWMHRRELAILISLGFPSTVLALYLIVQAGAITLSGGLLGAQGAWLVANLVTVQAAGYAIPLFWPAALWMQNTALLAAVTFCGIALPVLWLYRIEPDHILRAE